MLHTWMVIERIKGEGKIGKVATQHIFDYTFEDLKPRIAALGVPPMQRTAQVKELSKMFYGSCQAYNTAETTTDFAAALKRNVFNGKGTDHAVQQIVHNTIQLLRAVTLS
mmetsp:Transcript_39550/g.85627  ORF Transcript_39550/g.85627 Transcript_39550/m.85627 type:complete len:110 (-) Transcript_39550:196-525(-)